MKRTVRTAAVLSAAALVMTGCAGGGDGGATADGLTTVVVGASPVPHAEILQFVQDELAADAGLDLQIEEFTDYVLPNTALAEGEIDANFFQHLPYLASQIEENGFDFDHFEGVHIEPYGLYADSLDSLADLPADGTVAITNDPGNQGRALDLLADAGLITLAETDGDPTLLDVEDDPKGLQLVETAPEQLVVSLPDVDAAVINGNYALEAGLNPATDAILLEAGEGNPYANFLVTRTEDLDDPALVRLDELLHSDEVRAFIEERWPDGEILPAF
ncbi:MetQ/NlpA family ABC transporter substrate-binding protein [Cellulomonas wangsupingiae]|uniref:Lipoprotein n=1 Tax=Cellulomonas wangsupingiae TaxID=2968085 RepID=A0ABY5K355_9CELL|nr:MetQ/NlpA family ABC transporter substrate-binding protein [Cellulomonas wangsupingiae]MCC2336035.1 MetQ/NlpA family ABC transporter substrate-binding protein [Cellulomonas wangsupingiae]MCM0639654.1 MetQ/NlpA family ABC transporter substrate-binding protein [Cellulomonas wangsupingiae]UUI64760.1 MetQ/NlpA family ABC transporter substrate-binding protein [Cellulomonas wangsupingiae]